MAETNVESTFRGPGIAENDRGLSNSRPFVKWAGGKGQLITELLKKVPENLEVYREPFLGGGALFFALRRKGMKFRAFLSDTNPELINCYRVIKSSPGALIRQLRILRSQYRASANQEDYYYEIRDLKPIEEIQAAARFIFLNKTCYNGLYRENKAGKFNVPWGGYARPQIFEERNIFGVARALRETDAKIQRLDFKEALKSANKGEVVYLDPPYYPLSKTASFTDYTSRGFEESDHRDVAQFARDLKQKGCMVLVSNSETPFIRGIYAGFHIHRVDATRAISCNGEGRTGFHELIIS